MSKIVNFPKSNRMTKLSDKTFQELADTLTFEVISCIEQDSRYVDFMQEVIPDSLCFLMGQLDDDLKFELSLAIMDRIMLQKSK